MGDQHQHKAIGWSGDLPYRECVNKHRCNERSHGHVTFRRLCSCGMVQDVNAANLCFEASPWHPDPGDITEWRMW